MSGLFTIPFWKIAYHIVTKTAKKNDSTKKQYLEPLSTLFKLALISFKEDGTKLAVSNHRIYVQTPSILQGAIRSMYGNTREEIHYLLQPILQCVKLYPPQHNQELTYLYRLAIRGLRHLKKSYYNDSSTVCYTIDLYISILDRTLLSKSIYIDSYASSVTSTDTTNPPSSSMPSSGRDSPRGQSDLFDEHLDAETLERLTMRTIQDMPENAPLESIWKQIWSKDEIHLIHSLFQLTDVSPNASNDNKYNRVGYISSIEDILRAKEDLVDESIHRANLWI
jgi:hypothetical protein